MIDIVEVPNGNLAPRYRRPQLLRHGLLARKAHHRKGRDEGRTGDGVEQKRFGRTLNRGREQRRAEPPLDLDSLLVRAYERRVADHGGVLPGVIRAGERRDDVETGWRFPDLGNRAFRLRRTAAP